MAVDSRGGAVARGSGAMGLDEVIDTIDLTDKINDTF